jgi:hypothetical protein
VQVRLVDHVEVDDADGADAGGGEVHAARRAEPAGADEQDLGGLELALADGADLGQDEVAAVAADLLCGEVGERGAGGGQGCGGHRLARSRRLPPAIEGMIVSRSPDFTTVASLSR